MRETEKNVDKLFVNRWSSRNYDGYTLTTEEIETLLEAARWAPSSYNEQPWKFFFGKTKEQQAEAFSTLVEDNQKWVESSGFLCFVAAKRNFSITGKSNGTYAFDAGAAWMSLALQAHIMGLSAHGMSGFDHEKVYEIFGIDSNEYQVLAAIAVGRPTQNAIDNEERTPRKPTNEIIG